MALAATAMAAAISVQVELSDRQMIAWEALADPAIKEVLYGGAKGGGKSVFGCYWAWAHTHEIIKLCGLKPTNYPPPVGWMGRKQAVDFRDTTLESWKRFIPADTYEIRAQAREIIIGNTAKICYGGLDRSEDIQKFNSAEYGWIFVDQAEEISRDDIATPRGSMRLVLNGVHVRRKMLLTANPRQCWLKDEFLLSPKPHQRFVQALPSDNPWLPADYLDALTEAFSHRPELLEAYLHGNWDAISDADQVIRGEWVRQARGLQFHHAQPARLLVCDVARFGDDETVIYDMEETDILGEEIYGQRDLMFTANTLFVMQRDRGGCLIVVDDTGVGGGVTDRLREMGADVLAVKSAAKASDPEKFFNLRAEMWWNAARMFSQGDIALSHDDAQLYSQLCTVKYKHRGMKFLVEPKDEIKARLNRSPDRADTYIMGLHGLAFLRKSEFWRHCDGVSYFPASEPDKPPQYGTPAWRDEYARQQREEGPRW